MNSFVVFSQICLVGAIVVAGAVFDSAPVLTFCEDYAKLAANTPAGPAAPSKTHRVTAILGNAPPEEILVETPSKTIWVPKCKTIGPGNVEYDTLQTRVNGQKFCVYSVTGAILFDPSNTGKSAHPVPFECDCFNKRKLFSYERGAPESAKPVCNESTGAWIANKDRNGR